MSLGNFVKRFRDITRTDAGINGDAQRIEQLTWMLFLKVYDSLEAEWEALEDDFVSIIPAGCHAFDLQRFLILVQDLKFRFGLRCFSDDPAI